MKLINGECLDEMDILIGGGQKVDMVLTDPPYGFTRCKWDTIIPFEPMWDKLHKLTNDRTPIVLFGNEPFSSNLRMSNIKEYKYDIIWDKIIRTGFLNANRQPLRQYENIMVFYRKQCYYNPIKYYDKNKSHGHGRKNKVHNVYGAHKPMEYKGTHWKYPSNIYRLNSQKGEVQNSKKVHPTQKPVKLLEYLIKTFTKEGEVVLDFTMGSGSTGVACRNTNRDFIGIELDEEYFKIAEERIYDSQTRLM